MVVQNCLHFHKRAQTQYAGAGGQWPPYAFIYIFYYDALHFHYMYGVIKNQHFQSTMLRGREGVTKNSTSCTLLIMLTILDDP